MAKKNEVIDEVIKALNKKYHNAIITERTRYEFYPSGIVQWDAFIGGLPKGTLIEIFGDEEVGKTTLALTFCGAIQKADPKRKILYCDFEDVIDLGYAGRICDTSSKSFILAQPESLEEGWNLILDVLEQIPVSCIVVDSVAAMVPEAELDGDMTKDQIGLLPRKVGQALRKSLGLIRRKKVVAIFINQTRLKIGVLFGDPETTPGGKSIKFRAAIRARLTKTNSQKYIPKGFEYAELCRCKLVKNKITGRKTTFEWLVAPDLGIIREEEILRAALNYRILEEITERKGKGFYYKGNHLGKTRLEVVERVFRDEKNYQKIYKEIMEV